MASDDRSAFGGASIGRSAVLAIALIALAAVAPAAAAGRTLQAQGVLPPGQSGFVSQAGVASGTGSPHLTDQVSLFESFDYRPIGFNQPGEEQTPRSGVTITRDEYGVPSVRADDERDAWWGVGYAVAQDRLFQLELFRRATSGRLAEILGSNYLDDDLIARRDYYTDAEVDAMLAEIPDRLYRRTKAYRDGINAWIAEALADPVDKLPGEFTALGVTPGEWTAADIGRVGIFLARTVPSGDGNELENARALEAIGREGFRRLHPIRTRAQQATVPAANGAFPAQPGRTLADERAGFDRSARFLRGLDLGAIENTTERIGPGVAPAGEGGDGLRAILPSPGGSFMWAISDPDRQRAYQFNGPQLGYSIPELFVEFELHSPRMPRIHGVSAPGVPLVGIGHNGRVAWGFTSGLSDEDDLFVARLTGPETYRFRGREREMDCRDETFTWRSPPTDLPDALERLVGAGAAPAGATTERICRTVHGPVQYTGDGIVLARRYAIWKRELETFRGIDMLNRARDIGDVDEAMAQVTWNENVIAADDRGRIGYWHPGLHPLRPLRWDERLPYPGTGRAEWRGLLDPSDTPQVVDPARGWLANWNNPPSAGWTNGDGPARERLTGRFHRVRLIEELVADVARNPSYTRSTAIVRTSGTTAQQRPFVSEERLRQAKGLANPQGAATLDALLGWNGDYHTTDGDGTVDPGVSIWETFKNRLEAILLRPYGRKARILAGETSSTHQFDISNGEAVALRELGAGDYSLAAERTARRLERRFGTEDVSAWRAPRRMYEVAPMGAAQVDDLLYFDRGTWEQSIAVGR